MNSVSFQDGRKLHQSAADLQAHRLASDEICIAHGLEILPPPQRRVRQKRMGTREYRSAAKGQSWKFRLMNAIDQCMGCAATREEFISLMESEGYQVRWTEGRKNITYTTPQGMKCRDDRLHEEKYTKEVMEREFRIRAEIVHGGIETAELPPANPSQRDWDELLTALSALYRLESTNSDRLEQLEADVGAQAALCREISTRAGSCPTREQWRR